MTTETKPTLDLSFLKQFIEANPSVLGDVFKRQGAGRPKGKKNNLSVEPGKEIMVSNEAYEANIQKPETNVVEMTPKEARKLVEKMKRPHVYKSEETKAKMLEILKVGREKAKITREEKRKAKEEEKMKSMKIIKVKEYKKKEKEAKIEPRSIQRRPGRPRKLVEIESDDSVDETEETDEEIIRAKKKIEKKKALLKEIDEEIKQTQAPPQPQVRGSYASQFKW